MDKITLNNYNLYCEKLKPQDIIFSFCLTKEEGTCLTINNNYVAYVIGSNKSEPIFAVDTRFAFLVRELCLYALRDKFCSAAQELDFKITEQITKHEIRKTIILTDEGKAYRICAGFDGIDKNENSQVNELYRGIDNKFSQQFFNDVVYRLDELLKKYGYIK